MIATRTVGPRKLRLLQGSPEWLAARREYITATRMAAIEGVSPWQCEQDVYDEMTGATDGPESTLVMRVGNALEDLILDAYSEQEGRKARHVRGLWVSRKYPWAAASPDATAAGRLVELKWSGSRRRFADGLPEDVEVQARWQAMVAEVDVVDVAALVVGEDRVRVFTVERDPTIEAYLIGKAEDFRARLAAGGPFAQSPESIRRHHPTDDGSMLPVSPDLIELVDQYRAAKATKAAAENVEKTVANALRAVIRDASGIDGLITYRKSADSTRINWPAVASAYRQLVTGHPDEVLDALVDLHSETVQGPRVLRLVSAKGDSE